MQSEHWPCAGLNERPKSVAQGPWLILRRCFIGKGWRRKTTGRDGLGLSRRFVWSDGRGVRASPSPLMEGLRTRG